MDMPSIVLLVVFCLLSGFLLGRMDGKFREANDSDLPEDEKMDQEDVHVLRSASNGRLIIRHKKRSYHHVRSLPSDVHNRVLQMLVDLQAWMGHPAKPKANNMAEDPYTQGATLNGQQPSLAGETVKPVTFVSAIAHRLHDGGTKDKRALKSIVEQIDEILQDKLMTSPLRNRGIRLMELPAKGMVVFVGLERFENIGEIPDEDIQDIIRESVAEWEEGVVPGK